MSLQGARAFLLRRRGIEDGSTRLRPRPRRVVRSRSHGETMKAARARALADGRCVRCLCRPIDQSRSKVNCGECLDSRRQWAIDRYASGLCVNCAEPRMADKVYCAGHAEKNRIRTRDAKRRAAAARRGEVTP